MQVGSVAHTCRCNRAAAVRQVQMQAVQRVKNGLSALPPEQLAAFKKALGVDNLEFYTRTGKRVV